MPKQIWHSEIDAPFDGTIGFSQVKLGDYMNVGQSILNTWPPRRHQGRRHRAGREDVRHGGRHFEVSKKLPQDLCG